MIRFFTNGSELGIQVTTDVRTTKNPAASWYLDLFVDRTTELNAKLLKEHLDAKLRRTLQAIRKSAYDAGWKDAKAKKGGKRVLFSGMLDPNSV